MARAMNQLKKEKQGLKRAVVEPVAQARIAALCEDFKLPAQLCRPAGLGTA